MLAMLAITGPSLPAQDVGRVASLLEESDAFISAGQLDQALEKTSEALRMSPGSIAAMEKRISICILMGKDKEAMKYADAAIREYRDEPGFYYLRGIANNNLQHYGKALADFDRVLKNLGKTDAYKAYLGRGVAYMHTGQQEEAMSDLTKSIELNGTNAAAYHSRAMLNYEMKNYQAAADDFLKVLDNTKGSDILYFNLGMSYYRLDLNDKACPYFHESCTMGNENACRMVLMECSRSVPALK